jgi:hypothetical protein
MKRGRGINGRDDRSSGIEIRWPGDLFFSSLAVEDTKNVSVGKDVLAKDRHMRVHDFASGSLGFCVGWLSWVDPRRDTRAHGITGCQHKGR